MFKPVFLALILTACSSAVVAQEQGPLKELVQYVRDAKKAGRNEFQIQQTAIESGWPQATVNEAIAYVRTSDKNQPTRAESESAKLPAIDKKEAVSPTNPDKPGKPDTPPASDTPSGTPATRPEGESVPGSVKPVEKTPPVDAAIVKPASVNRGVPDDYQIGAGDVVEINVWKEPDASVHSVVVRPDGKISMPLLKDVGVVGLTPLQLEKLITDGLANVINTPDVTIVVTGINSKKIYVTGKVKKEGPISYTYRMTVMQALSEAGGITDYAKKKAIYVLHTENGKEFRLPFDYAAVLKGQRMELNIQLMPGDMIVVP
jgi:polysaccharide export outer membrane protein